MTQTRIWLDVMPRRARSAKLLTGLNYLSFFNVSGVRL